MKFPNFKRNKIKTIIRDDKKLKGSYVYKQIMEIERKLKNEFKKEAINCKHLSSIGCTHKNNKNGYCNINSCPK
jgi:hypothetical protein